MNTNKVFIFALCLLVTASMIVSAVTITPQTTSRTLRNDTQTPILDYMDTVDYNYAEDAEFDGNGFQYPYEAEAVANGKTYHYVFGATTSGGQIYTFPIDTRDYQYITFQILESNIANSAGSSITATVSGGGNARFFVRGSMYPQHFISSGYSGYTYMPADVINGTTYAEDLTPAGAGKAIAGVSGPGIYRFELGRAISRIIFSCSAHAITGGVKNTTQHLIVRVNN